VISTTKVGGIAYESQNIYFSVWINFFVTIYALNDWMKEKNQICFRDLTHMSLTMPGWYVLAFSSTVLFGSVVDGIDSFLTDESRAATAVAILAGLLSMIVSSSVILSYYRLCCCFCDRQVPVRGWWEFLLATILTILWLAELELTTQYGSFGATVDENSCSAHSYPGSNVYIFSWMSFLAAGYVVLQWKAERAMEFTQTSERGVVESEKLDATSKEQGDSDI